MGDETAMPSRKPSAELIAIVAVGVTILLGVLGQAAWLDGKIERLHAKLSGDIHLLGAKLSGEIERLEDRLDIKIAGLQQGQAAIRERLAAVESRIATATAVARVEAET